MSRHVQSILDDGNSGVVIDIECTVANALPCIVIVGLGNKSIDESKERIRSAFTSSKINFPRKKITLNLAPSDIPKDSSAFDLGMSMAILQSAKLIEQRYPEKTIVLGELGLDGAIKPIRGIIGKIINAQEKGYTHFIIPSDNIAQAALLPDIFIYAPKTLRELYETLTNDKNLPFTKSPQRTNILATEHRNSHSLDDVIDQEIAKRALLIAAAGHHNILLSGPPGSGKSMLAKGFTSILPTPNTKEILEITHIHSLVSKDYGKLYSERPLRTPHHSSSYISIVGGGQKPKPGEISLAHNGVLFLDEMPEFNKQVIESLRQPLEDRKITISRVKDSIEFPASFILIATANPCPCGYYGSKKECVCQPYLVQKYQQKISGPILDRVDLYVGVDEVEHAKLLKPTSSKNNYLEQVVNARDKQLSRSGKLNSALTNKELIEQAKLSPATETFLNTAAAKLELSARSYMRILKLARTIADLENSDCVETVHLTEALQYRKKEITL